MLNLTLFFVLYAKDIVAGLLVLSYLALCLTSHYSLSYMQSYSSWSINAELSGIMFNLTLFYVIYAKVTVAGLLMQCYLVLCLTSHYSMSYMPKL